VNRSAVRVLFVCVGNACRSQMAEAFARTYGAGVVEAGSAGLAPAFAIPESTRASMREKGLELTGQSPKPLSGADYDRFDLIINMSGATLPPAWAGKVREWSVADPIGQSDEVYRGVRDQIEARVQSLLLELRTAAPAAPGPRRRSRPRLLRG
jgi:arsenate reductase